MLGEVGLAILALAVQPTLSCLTSLDLRSAFRSQHHRHYQSNYSKPYIADNFIRDSGLEALALSLQKNPPLVFLNLQRAYK